MPDSGGGTQVKARIGLVEGDEQDDEGDSSGVMLAGAKSPPPAPGAHAASETAGSGKWQVRAADNTLSPLDHVDPEGTDEEGGGGGGPADLHTTYRQWVYGFDYIDEVVAMYSNKFQAATPFYVLQDGNWNVAAVTDSDGNLLQQYWYEPYGERLTENHLGQSVSDDAVFCDMGFAGGLRNHITGKYISRSGRLYNPPLGRWNQRDPNGLALMLQSVAIHSGSGWRVAPRFSARAQYLDGLSPFGYARHNPNVYTDPMGLFSYAEITTSVGIQGALGGFANGLISKFAGGDFWEAFATGAIGGALGGGAGYAFAASRAGFLGGVVLGRAAEGFAEEAGGTFYSTGDFRDSLVQGLYGAAMNVALGGFGDLAAKHVLAVGKLIGSRDALRRKNSIRPTFGEDSFRHRLAELWGMAGPPPGHVAHHVLPLKFAPQFRKADIEPDNVLFGAWWEEVDHALNHDEYNRLWKRFFDKYPDPSPEQIIEKGIELSKRFGVDWIKG